MTDKRERETYGDSDSDLEEPRNRVGDIPMEWYNDFDHIGYGVDGKPLMKRMQSDAIADLVRRADDPSFWYMTVWLVVRGCAEAVGWRVRMCTWERYS